MTIENTLIVESVSKAVLCKGPLLFLKLYINDYIKSTQIRNY